tara:strand:+ start:149 stop:319 length:171 start_codon:yes stop_codon:yes gene_type:complete
MIIFDIPNYILSFAIVSAGLLMLTLSMAVFLMVSSIVSRVFRDWLKVFKEWLEERK